MSPYILYWERRVDLVPHQSIVVRDSEDAKGIIRGDVLFVITLGRKTSLLARLRVNNCIADSDREALILDINDPETAFFFRRHVDAVPVILPPGIKIGRHREIIRITDEAASLLSNLYGISDFSSRISPPMWPGILQRVYRNVTRAIRDGDKRPGIDIATEYLRKHYVTSELPGPSPVYVNAARQALFPTGSQFKGTVKATKRKRINLRNRATLTDEAINAGVNDDVALTLIAPPEKQRHQSILRELRDRLLELGLEPKYDGFVDCIVETPGCDLYFEVKSGTPGSLSKQLYVGTGQLLYYIWLDSKQFKKRIRGYLVMEGVPNMPEEYYDFVKSVSLSIIWSSDVAEMVVEDLELRDVSD
jgi:hypothetical protein